MVNNIDRADWAREALQVFADRCMAGDLTEETLCDLICNIGHYAELELMLSRNEAIRVYSIGIGAWSAESKSPLDEPDNNDAVTILINDER